MALRPNPGHCPRAAQGKRVRVVLTNGFDTARTAPQGWPADGRWGVNWQLPANDPWAIAQWEIAA
ncbi:hypothetical protein QQS45_00050 [Alteriqipengyuania flavescens]|uniref:hypothetical protein n=1 Tax=Alteriqipengyuania flavescens TaxID=3053610 RepID=UPI0025B42D8E|nr:hypothetical protein [Alteriqipengyuania flavescens]WJY18681.1 hypothetical protein QQW98_00050 [Alteriqipengyuania flavescens]WJY24621.1 hypothetical protein QQS45_00050 [Alteriqipengyuania flavescens]